MLRKVLGSYGASLGGLQHSRRLWESRRGCYPRHYKWSQGNCHASHYQRRECRIQRHDGNYQCCSELRTRGRKAGGASRWQESAAGQARGQAGRHAAEQAAKEAAQTFGIEVTKVTAKGVEVVASMGSPAATSKGAEVAMQEGTRMATEGAGGWLQTEVCSYKGELSMQLA